MKDPEPIFDEIREVRRKFRRDLDELKSHSCEELRGIAKKYKIDICDGFTVEVWADALGEIKSH